MTVMMGMVAPDPDGPIVALDNPPTFSAVVPVYEGAHMVAEAVASVLDQTVPACEVIIADDGSTDDLAGALMPFSDRVTVLHQAHKGLAAARNLALFHAKGEFIAHCDADDAFLPRYLEAMGKLVMARPDLDIFSRTCYLERDGKPDGLTRTPENLNFPEDQRLGILHGSFLGGSAVFRRQRLIDLGGYDESLLCAEDYDAWARMIFAGSRAALLLDPLAIRREHEGSLSTRTDLCAQGVITTLTKLMQRNDLSPAERALARKRIRESRGELARYIARSAVLEGRPDARWRSLRVLFGEGQHPRNRAKAALASLSPRWAQWHRRERSKSMLTTKP